MAWKKGQSGNPGGRPKKDGEVINLARQHGTAAIRRLIALMDADDPRISLAACSAVLDRGFGKPLQAVESTVDLTTRRAEELTDETLAHIATGSSEGASEAQEGPEEPSSVH